MTKSIDIGNLEFWMAKSQIKFFQDDTEPNLYPDAFVKCVPIVDAKARDAQFLAVVNELREALKFTPLHACQTGDCDHSWHISCTKTFQEYVDDSLTKADQMLKEMGIK